MNSFTLLLKQFFKNKFSLIFSAIFFLFSIGYAIYGIILCNQQELEPLNYLSQTLNISMFSFVFFMFISNEYLYKITQFEVKEALKSTKNGHSSFYFFGFLVLTFILFLYTLIFLVINIATYFFQNVGSTEYFFHIINNVMFNIFCVSLIGILFGGIVSFVKVRIVAYLLMTAMVFIASPAFDLISTTVFA